MKRVGDYLTVNRKTEKLGQEKHELCEETAKVVNWLFQQLSGMIPAMRYAANNTETLGHIKKQWTIGIFEARLHDMIDIKAGLTALRKRGDKFLPTVAEFIGLCEQPPEKLGLPSIKEAYEEALKLSRPGYEQEFSHPVVRYARNDVSSWRLTHEPHYVTWTAFAESYKNAVKLYREGKLRDALPMPDIYAIQASEQEKIDSLVLPQHKNKKDAHSALNEMRKILAMGGLNESKTT